jgi:flagellin
MPLVIQTNVASLEAEKNLNTTTSKLSVSFNRLSSGFRINSAADDAAGLAISESMQMQIRSYTVAERNANDGISMAQTAEGALGQMTSLLDRMRELAVQSANGTLSSTDRSYIDTEFTSLKAEMDRIQQSTTYDGQALLATTASSIQFQVGINNTSSDQIIVTFGGLGLTVLLSATTNTAGTTASAALNALGRIDAALSTITTKRAAFGAIMNRLANTTSALETVRTNLSAANSRIRDVDVAEESSNMARTQVLAQAGTAVLAQANQLPQIALSLLRG